MVGLVALATVVKRNRAAPVVVLCADGALRDSLVDLFVADGRRVAAEIVAGSVAHSPAHAETEADRLESVEAARRYLEESLEKLRDRADRVGVRLEHAVIEGDHPADDLLAYAHEHAFDLVVAGHHARSRAGRLVLHGFAEKLALAGTIPVLIIGDPGG
jgi:nucleotide-binding universal stress UspA family protein